MSKGERWYRIIIDGTVAKECPAYSTPLEVQHEITVETKRFVRVEQFRKGGARGPRESRQIQEEE